MKMEEKRYLKLGTKICYGMGDTSWCFISMVISSFMLIYLTDAQGMSSAIVGTLMLVARVFDGVTDVLFGRILDKTHTKWGKARPWQFVSMIGCAIALILLFSMPESMGDSAKYVYFFIFYMLCNTVFYTFGYIAYSTLMSLMTRNAQEQVESASFRTIGGNLGYCVLGIITVPLVAAFGGGAAGYRTLAIVYGIAGFILNTISVFICKEIPEEEMKADAPAEEAVNKEKLGPVLKSVLKCKYFYFMILIMMILYLFAGVWQTSGVYYATYALGNANFTSLLSGVNYGVTMCAAFIVPFVTKKVDPRKAAIIGLAIGIVARAFAAFGGIGRNVSIILIGMAIATIGTAFIQTLAYSMMGSTSEYIFLKDGVRANGIVFSCTSMGNKIGQGIGTALCGVWLSASGYVANAAQQTDSCINMLTFMYLIFPIICNVAIFIITCFCDVDKQLVGIKKEKGLIQG